MTKLNQILALETDAKKQAADTQHTLSTALNQPQLFNGQHRQYQPRDDDGEELPSESERVRFTVAESLDMARDGLVRLFDLTATKDWTNTRASADVVIGGQVLLEGVPPTYLLFLEKQLTQIEEFVRRLPVLDPSSEWTKDEKTGHYRTEPVRTNRSKKVPRRLVKYEATDKHPAQVDVYTEDVPVGTWSTTKISGAIERIRAQELLNRVRRLQAAVKSAREEANSVEVTDKKVGDVVFNYLFAV